MITFVVAFKSLNSGCSRKSSRCGRIYSYAGPRKYEVRNKSFFLLVLSLSAFKVKYVKHCSLKVLTWLRYPENSDGAFTLNDPPPPLFAPVVDPVTDISSRVTLCNQLVTNGIDWLVSRGVASSSGVESILDSSSDEVSLIDSSSSLDIHNVWCPKFFLV
jgi:hypothetical protein